MADNTPKKFNVGPPKLEPLTRTNGQKKFFYLDDKLYKVLRQNRPSDLLYALDMETRKMVQFVLSDAKRKMKPAYDTKEVARFINRHPVQVGNYVRQGVIEAPFKVISKNAINASGVPFGSWKWREEDIIALHEHLLTVGNGKTPKDGILAPGPRLPSRKELLAMLRSQPMFYMQTAGGEMVPVWSAYNEV